MSAGVARRGPLRRRRRAPTSAPLVAAALLAVACGGKADRGPRPRLERAFRVEPLEGPESVAWDARRDRWLVANAGGGRGGGSVAAFSAGGSGRRPGWSDSVAGLRLSAPRGIVVAADTAWIADTRSLIAVDLVGDSVLSELRLGGAGRLDDVVRVEDGTLFVSDGEAGVVWRIVPGGSAYRRVPAVGSLRGPAGLVVEGPGSRPTDRLLVAGSDGAVLAVNRDSSVVLLAESPRFGRLDGLQRAPDGGLLVGDRDAGRLHHLRRHSRQVWRTGRPWLTGLAAPADFVIRDSLLVLPEAGANRVTAYRILPP